MTLLVTGARGHVGGAVLARVSEIPWLALMFSQMDA
jgi:uncharacterized protein YbjT (DUF2867 family)